MHIPLPMTLSLFAVPIRSLSLTPRHTFSWNSTASTTGIVQVIVGAAGQLAFSPAAVDADVGTIIRFDFLGRNHTLTQTNSESSCSAGEQFDTGFQQFNPSNTSGTFVVDLVVKSKEPQFFYCAQTLPTSHCQAGMTFRLNAGPKAGDLGSTGWHHTTSQRHATGAWCAAPTRTLVLTQSVGASTVVPWPSSFSGSSGAGSIGWEGISTRLGMGTGTGTGGTQMTPFPVFPPIDNWAHVPEPTMARAGAFAIFLFFLQDV